MKNNQDVNHDTNNEFNKKENAFKKGLSIIGKGLKKTGKVVVEGGKTFTKGVVSTIAKTTNSMIDKATEDKDKK